MKIILSTPNFDIFLITCLMVASCLLGLGIGFEEGSPIQNITEIVWIERTPEPLNMLLWDVECVLVAKETTS